MKKKKSGCSGCVGHWVNNVPVPDEYLGVFQLACTPCDTHRNEHGADVHCVVHCSVGCNPRGEVPRHIIKDRISLGVRVKGNRDLPCKAWEPPTRDDGICSTDPAHLDMTESRARQ